MEAILIALSKLFHSIAAIMTAAAALLTAGFLRWKSKGRRRRPDCPSIEEDES